MIHLLFEKIIYFSKQFILNEIDQFKILHYKQQVEFFIITSKFVTLDSLSFVKKMLRTFFFN